MTANVTGGMARVVGGPAELRVNGVSVGRTSGPVRVRLEPVLREVKAIHTGETPVDYVVIGVRAEVRATLAEHALENVRRAFPSAAEAEGCAEGVATLGALPGRRLSETAATLTVHPLERDSDDESEDFVLHAAVAVGTVEIEHSPEGDRLIEARFVGLADVSRDDGDMVARLGAPRQEGGQA